jgi:hypothetical protein
MSIMFKLFVYICLHRIPILNLNVHLNYSLELAWAGKLLGTQQHPNSASVHWSISTDLENLPLHFKLKKLGFETGQRDIPTCHLHDEQVGHKPITHDTVSPPAARPHMSCCYFAPCGCDSANGPNWSRFQHLIGALTRSWDCIKLYRAPPPPAFPLRRTHSPHPHHRHTLLRLATRKVGCLFFISFYFVSPTSVAICSQRFGSEIFGEIGEARLDQVSGVVGWSPLVSIYDIWDWERIRRLDPLDLVGIVLFFFMFGISPSVWTLAKWGITVRSLTGFRCKTAHAISGSVFQ